MKKLMFIISILILPAITSAKNIASNSSKPSLSTKMHFNGMKVNGRYNIPGEALIKAEGDKELNNLLVLPMNFRDRIRENLTRD